ncbi:MAG: hypothetical protein HRU23_01585 [Gammaproteobacteria bacterium]|nr:hypothetical protein [Gammaproteobacteria bacterium]
MRKSEPLNVLAKLFSYLTDESFLDGRSWALAQLREHSVELYQDISLFDHNQSQPLAGQHTDSTLLLIYSAQYFNARIMIENSYHYRDANQMIKLACAALAQVSDGINSEFIQALSRFSQLQHWLCEIDRGIYNSYADTLAVASGQLIDDTQVIKQLSCNFDQASLVLFNDNLRELLDAYAHYGIAIQYIAQLNLIKWDDRSEFGKQLATIKPLFDQQVSALEAMGQHILAGDLCPHFPILQQFLAQRTADEGKLVVSQGRVEINYFSRLGYDFILPFEQFVATQQQSNGGSSLAITALYSDIPEWEPMSDIWSGLAANGIVETLGWNLPDLVINFRGHKLSCTVELKYYSTGMFNLSINLPIEQQCISGVRHAASLGTAFALDQEMLWHDNKHFSFVAELADYIFSQLDIFVKQSIPSEADTSGDLLYYNVENNRFVQLQVDRVFQQTQDNREYLTSEQLLQHCAFVALVLPQREVRSAIDDWVAYDTSAIKANNIGAVRYNKNDLLFCNQFESVIALTEQPMWVTEQAAESLKVAAMIINLLQSANTQFNQQLKLADLSQRATSKNSTKELVVIRKKLATQLLNLVHFEDKIKWLFEIISAGSMMTYPDHTKLMKQILNHMQFEQLHQRSIHLLTYIESQHQQTVLEIENVDALMASKEKQRLNSILSGAMLLISVGALKDFFDMINDAEIGVVLSGFSKFSITTGALLFVLYALMKGANSKD